MHFKKNISVAVLSLLTVLISCNWDSKDPKDYQNKDVQTVAKGETVSIYYTTNSCCAFCVPNMDDLNHLEFIGEETIIPSPSDCDGCGYTEAFLFKAKSVGTDTILGCVHGRGIDCSDTLNNLESFIIHVK